MDIKLSIIIPEHNHKQFCLDSIRELVPLNGVEIIVVSDIESESDFSGLVMFDSASLRFERNTSGMLGAGACRNIGISLAKGRYICFLDSDDFLERKTVLSFLETEDVFDCCFYRVEAFGRKGTKRHVRYNRLVEKIKLDNSIIAHYSVPWGKIIRRQFVIDNGLNFDEVLASNDIGFQAKMSRQSSMHLKFEMSSTLYYVRDSPSSLTKTFTDEVILARYYAKLINQGNSVSYTFAHNLFLSLKLSRPRYRLKMFLEIIFRRRLFRNWEHLKSTLKRL